MKQKNNQTSLYLVKPKCMFFLFVCLFFLLLLLFLIIIGGEQIRKEKHNHDF